MTSAETQITDLKFNLLSRPQYDYLSANDMLVDQQFYLVKDDTFDAGGYAINNVGVPQLSTDAANKAYVDSLKARFNAKLSSLDPQSSSVAQVISALQNVFNEDQEA